MAPAEVAADRAIDLEACGSKPPSASKCGWLLFVAGMACAMLNNLSYCIISGAAQDLARHFHRENDSSVLTTALFMSSFLGTLITTRCLIRYFFSSRIVLVLVLSFSSYFGIAMVLWINHSSGFWVCAVCTCFAGLAQIFGETTNLAFFRNLPPEMVGAWGAGSGAAGIVGPLLYLALRARLPPATVFFIATPIPLIYAAIWTHLYGRATRGLSGPELQRVLGGTPSLHAATADDRSQTSGGTARASRWFARERAAISATGGLMLNLAAGYFLSYFIAPGLVDRETFCAPSVWFTVMWACRYVGVTVSRGSVAWFRIKRVSVVTLLQLVNVLGWTAEVFWGGIRGSVGGYTVMAGWMVLVGLLGGSSYANCMYLFNHDPSIPDEHRELGINLGFFMSNAGIFLATCSFSVLNRTIFSPHVLYPGGCAPVSH